MLRLRQRERISQRYVAPQQRRLRREADAALDAAFRSSHRGIGLDARLALFVPGLSSCVVRDPLPAPPHRADPVVIPHRTKRRIDVLGGAAPALLGPEPGGGRATLGAATLRRCPLQAGPGI